MTWPGADKDYDGGWERMQEHGHELADYLLEGSSFSDETGRRPTRDRRTDHSLGFGGGSRGSEASTAAVTTSTPSQGEAGRKRRRREIAAHVHEMSADELVAVRRTIAEAQAGTKGWAVTARERRVAEALGWSAARLAEFRSIEGSTAPRRPDCISRLLHRRQERRNRGLPAGTPHGAGCRPAATPGRLSAARCAHRRSSTPLEQGRYSSC